MKKALITGITGQDGSYLADLLLEKGYEVHGIIRRASTINTHRLDHIYQDPHEENPKLHLHYGDLSDASNLSRLLEKIQPDEIYNLGAQSHVRVSFDTPEYTSDVTGLGALRLLDAIRETGIKTKFYQASSSEMFGKAVELPLKETSQFHPRSPYGCAKVYAYWITKNYRESYGLFACNGILFNHESPRRGETFVTRKITRAASRIAAGLQQSLSLGNIHSKRDWGFAPEYCEGMWRILNHDKAEDFVLATGETHTIKEFVEYTFRELGIEINWQGEAENEEGIISKIDLSKAAKLAGTDSQNFQYQLTNDLKIGHTIIKVDPNYYRPTEVDLLIGDPTKVEKVLGWKAKTKFEDLVKVMIQADLEKVLKRGF